MTCCKNCNVMLSKLFISKLIETLLNKSQQNGYHNQNYICKKKWQGRAWFAIEMLAKCNSIPKNHRQLDLYYLQICIIHGFRGQNLVYPAFLKHS